MKKLLLATLLIGMVSSCAQPTVKAKPTKHTVQAHSGEASRPLEIATIEGCEYFVCNTSHGYIFTHKGNCKNLIHKR